MRSGISFVQSIVLVLFLSACAAPYKAVPEGVNRIGDLYVVADSGWNLAPYIAASSDRKSTKNWTRDGLLLNTLAFIPAVPDGEALVSNTEKGAVLPVFRADMLPNEIEELAESTFVRIFGEGNAVFDTSDLRPHMFGTHRGFLFNVQARVTESPDYKGIAGAFVADAKLYFMYYLAADPYYYEKDLAAAEAIIRSATLTAPAQAT
jgi:hypothetical protein